MKFLKLVLISFVFILTACSNSLDYYTSSCLNDFFVCDSVYEINVSSSLEFYLRSSSGINSSSSLSNNGERYSSIGFQFSSSNEKNVQDSTLGVSSSKGLAFSSEKISSSSSCYGVIDFDSTELSYSSSETLVYPVEVEFSSSSGNIALIDSIDSSSSSILNDLIESSESQENECIVDDSFVFRYIVKNGFMRVAIKNDSNDLVIELGKMDIGNNLFDFRKFGKVKRCGDFGFDDVVPFFAKNWSDWIGPFQVAAVANKDGDDTGSGSGYDEDGFKITFTGGAHRYNNTTSGSTPTARLAEVEFRINGESITEGNGYGSLLEIKWTSFIQAYNTKKSDGSGREVLKENVYLKYDGEYWDVETELEPLEKVAVRVWYGYQMTGVGSDMVFHWIFVNGQNSIPDQSASGVHDTRGILAYGGSCDVEMWIDTSVGLGMREFLKENDASSAFKSGNKLYFKIINDESKTLIPDKSYLLKGSYKFGLP